LPLAAALAEADGDAKAAALADGAEDSGLANGAVDASSLADGAGDSGLAVGVAAAATLADGDADGSPDVWLAVAAGSSIPAAHATEGVKRQHIIIKLIIT
jgi:hypothetical protein